MIHTPVRRFLASVALLSAVLLLVSARPASATTITPGSVTVFNFDFTGQVPPPPYVDVSIVVFLANVDFGDSGDLDLYGGLNGTGVLLDMSHGQLPTDAVTFSGVTPALVDGVFSVRVLGTNGAYDILAATALAHSATGGSTQVRGVVVTAVPEPTTLTLLATGLAGVLARRRRRHS